MWRNKWSIAVYQGSSPFKLEPAGSRIPAISPESITDIKCRTVADPFLLRRSDHWYLFCEAWNDNSGRGEIGFATSVDGLEWSWSGIVLREDFHLSYPHVFEHNGTVYMVPETRQADTVRLYAALSFPHDWRLVNVLIRGPYADSTVFFHDGVWWMFSQRGLDEMRIFYSGQLDDGWTMHPMNPIWPGNRTYSRPGGRVIQVHGDLYRFAQDGVLTYGNNLRAMRIKHLSKLEFEEEEIPQSPVLSASLKGWNALGMHHLDAVETGPDQWLGAVDGATAGI
jgi:hypothetical protein